LLLRKFVRIADRRTATGQSVYNDAWDAIAYLDQRTELWRQERSTEKCVAGSKTYSTATEKVKINNWISRELDKIDWGENILC
jgi:hypothetical protein